MKISLDSPFFEKGERIGELFMAGFLWILFSMPVITTGAASCALYYTTVKVVRRKRDTVWRAFWSSFRSSLKQGTVITLIYILAGSLLWAGASAWNQMQGQKERFMLVAAIFMIILPFAAVLPWIFPVISRFQTGLLRQIQYAVYMAVRHFGTTLLLLLFLLLTILLIYFFPFCLILLPGIDTWLSSLYIERVLKIHMKHEIEKYEDPEDLPWYLE